MPSTNRNDALHELLLKATGLEPEWTSDAKANPFGWLKLTRPSQLADAAKALSGKMRLCTVTAYSEERDDLEKRRRIAYHFASKDTVVTVTVPIYDSETMQKLPVPSITPWFRNADWNEREFREMFNIDIQGHPNPNRLFLDERLDAGIMTKLIPFSAMANSASTNTLWERILEAKGVPPEERMPSMSTPTEPIKVEAKVTPVTTKDEVPAGGPTLAAIAAPAEAAVAALEATGPEHSPSVLPESAADPQKTTQPVPPAEPKEATPEKPAQSQPVQAEQAAGAKEVASVQPTPVNEALVAEQSQETPAQAPHLTEAEGSQEQAAGGQPETPVLAAATQAAADAADESAKENQTAAGTAAKATATTKSASAKPSPKTAGGKKKHKSGAKTK